MHIVVGLFSEWNILYRGQALCFGVIIVSNKTSAIILGIVCIPLSGFLVLLYFPLYSTLE